MDSSRKRINSPDSELWPPERARNGRTLAGPPLCSTTFGGSTIPPLFGGGGAVDPFAPSGSWIGLSRTDNMFIYSNDGLNWQRVAFAASGFARAEHEYDFSGNTLALASVDVNTTARLLTDLGTPGFTDGGSGNTNLANFYAHGPGWIARASNQLLTSSDALTWNVETPPVNFPDAFFGQVRFSTTAGLFIAMGISTNVNPDGYWTSGDGVSWTLRTFPVNWPAPDNDLLNDFVDNGSIAVIALSQNGANQTEIYSSTDLLSWTLRFTTAAFEGISGLMIWNPVLSLFFMPSDTATVDHNLLTSPDGITWTYSRVGNNLRTNGTNGGNMAVDPSTGLMYVSRNGNGSAFSSNPDGVSLDGITWQERFSRSCFWKGFHPSKIGPTAPSLTLTPASRDISDTRVTPTNAFARVIWRTDNTIDEQTSAGGITEFGSSSTGGVDTLNAAGVEVMLEQLTGPALNFGTSALDTWLDGDNQYLWGYATTLGIITGTFIMRARYKGTGTEISETIEITLTATSV